MRTDSSRSVREKDLPKLAELVKTEAAPPVDSAPPATPKLHPPTHKSAEGLRIARQKAAEATRAEVPKQAQTAPVAAPAAPGPRGACQYPLWGDRERSDPGRFCNAPTATRDVRGVPVQSPYCQKHHDICYTKTAGWGQRSPLHEVKRADPAGGDSADAFLNPS